MTFETFLKGKKKKKGQEKKAEPPTPPKKEIPKAPKAPKKPTKKEKIKEKREELSPEVVGDEAAEAILEHEASKEKESTDREDDTEAETVEKSAKRAPEPPAKKAPSPPKPKETPKLPKAEESAPKKPLVVSTPVMQPTPEPALTWQELADKVQVSDFGDEYDSSGYGDKISITVVGEKGGGKSTYALAFKGKKLIISYDRMAKVNKYKMRDPENIKVIDPMTIFDSSTALKKRNSMALIFDYLIGVEEYVGGPRVGGLLNTHEPVDWIIHDGTDILMEICEMVMRVTHDLLPNEGVEWTKWKDRKYAIQDIYHKSLSLARKGIIFTTYFTEKDIDEDITGQKKKKQMPKWMDIVLHQTMHTFVPYSQGDGFFLYVAQSKSVKRDISRKVFDITGVSYETDEVDEDGNKIWKMDFDKLYEVVEDIEREVF